MTVPRATAKRLPVYYRYLRYLQNAGVDRVSSEELAEVVKVDSATIRRDFSYFGALGKRGYGYDVEYLIEFFGKALHQDTLTNVALIGVGNIGNALLRYNFRKNNIRISAAFDVKEELVNKLYEGIPVYHIDDLEKQIQEQAIEIAILAVPQQVSADIVERILKAGIRGILNFTPLRFDAPKGVKVQNVDITGELQTLVYFVQTEHMVDDVENEEEIDI